MIEHGWSPVTCTVAFAVVPGDTFSNSATPQLCKRSKSSATSCDDKPGAADVIVDCHAHAGIGPMRIAKMRAQEPFSPAAGCEGGARAGAEDRDRAGRLIARGGHEHGAGGYGDRRAA